MKIPSIISAAIVYGASSISAFVVLPASPAGQSAARLNMIGRESNVDLTGNSWKPDSEKMGVRLVRCRLLSLSLRRCSSNALMYVDASHSSCCSDS